MNCRHGSLSVSFRLIGTTGPALAKISHPGGKQREERLDVLQGNLEHHGMSEADYGWYLDLRKYGSCPHAGFGMGFERMLMFATGMKNIRDVIPFARTPGSCEF